MIKSILIGLLLPSLILISGWVRLLFSLISIGLGNGIPFLYFLFGIMLGIGEFYKKFDSYWVTYSAGMLLSLLIYLWSSTHDRKSGLNHSTVTICGSGFITGGIIGMIIGLFL
jgi:hypothetical protein